MPAGAKLEQLAAEGNQAAVAAGEVIEAEQRSGMLDQQHDKSARLTQGILV